MTSFLDIAANEVGAAFVREFGIEFLYTPAGGTARRVRGIYDRFADPNDISALIVLDGDTAKVEMESSTVSELAIGDVMAIDSTSYRVTGIEDDGTGRVVAYLGR